jgi:hypothetical protein
VIGRAISAGFVAFLLLVLIWALVFQVPWYGWPVVILPFALGVYIGKQGRKIHDWHPLTLILALILMVYPPLQLLTIGDALTIAIFVATWLMGVVLLGVTSAFVAIGPEVKQLTVAGIDR